jgi:hypothetical protein
MSINELMLYLVDKEDITCLNWICLAFGVRLFVKKNEFEISL